MWAYDSDIMRMADARGAFAEYPDLGGAKGGWIRHRTEAKLEGRDAYIARLDRGLFITDEDVDDLLDDSHDSSDDHSGADSQLFGRDAWVSRLEHLADEFAANCLREFQNRRAKARAMRKEHQV